MPSKRILIVPDKFKGTLTAREAAAAIAAGWSEVRPADQLELLPMADGGDGFGEVIGRLLGAQLQTCATVDSAGRPRDAAWWFESSAGIAVIETAEVNGLALLPAQRYHPFELDTFGIGSVLFAAEQAGARRVYLGIGGSATNDGGFGLARSLGWKFWDASGVELLAWSELTRLMRVTAPPRPLAFNELTIAVDVDNPLLGPNGATRIYGRQKGLLSAEDVAHAEACLQRLAEVCAEHAASEAGAGAGGGLGFGLSAFAGGSFRSGGDIFSSLTQLPQRIRDVDCVVTAEGRMDQQTLMGKGVGLVAKLAAAEGKQCLCLAGSVSAETGPIPWPSFQAFSIVPNIADLQEALTHPADCLRRLAAKVASLQG